MDYISIGFLLIISNLVYASDHIYRVYHGSIREDAKVGDAVEFDHPLVVQDWNDLEGDTVCGYTLYKMRSELPFKAVMLESPSITGEAKIVLAEGYKLDYAKRSKYTFQFAAYDCATGKHTKRKKAHVLVEEADEYDDEMDDDSNDDVTYDISKDDDVDDLFENEIVVDSPLKVETKPSESVSTASLTTTSPFQPSPAKLGSNNYLVEVEEGKIFPEILRLQESSDAVEKEDEEEEGGRSCHFVIKTPDVPFAIDGAGVLTNLLPFNYSLRHNYILEVEAEDCGRTTTENLFINVLVKPAHCDPGWKGIGERFDYAPGSGPQPLADHAHLDLCDLVCEDPHISVRLTLSTDHIGKGCDRDTYSVQSQRKLCGASPGAVDLLPSTSLGLWSVQLPLDDGHESDQIFSFDGSTNAVEVPDGRLNHSVLGQEVFTLSFWMKHKERKVNGKDMEGDSEEDVMTSGPKEQIVCNSDGEEMDRHHQSLFIHNCKLVLLMRREPTPGEDLNLFRPAERRWKTPEVCDDQWHHYAVNVQGDEATLFIDGRQFAESKDNFELLDDLPLLPSNKIHSTKLVVGACWHAVEKVLTQHFRGFLADVSVLPRRTETASVIQCLNNCKEKLDFHAINEMETGMSITFNSDQTEMTIDGHSAGAVEKMVTRVGYINSRTFPVPGRRPLTLDTTVNCSSGVAIVVPKVVSSVLVQVVEEPIIELSGATRLSRTEHDLEHGDLVFREVTVTCRTRQEAKEESEQLTNGVGEKSGPKDDDSTRTSVHKLDSCSIRVNPPLKLEIERLAYPSNLLVQLQMEAYESENGLVMAGAEDVHLYERVLRGVQYVNSRPEELNSRTFVISCSELNGRFVSNDHKIKVDVIHVAHDNVAAPKAVAAAAVNDLEAKEVIEPVKIRESHSGLEQKHGLNGAGVGIILIVIVCVGFLLFIVGVGIMRIRASRKRAPETVAVDAAPEMEWDNSALTITINPMEQENLFDGEHDVSSAVGIDGVAGDMDSESEEEAGHHHGDDAESSEGEAETPVVVTEGTEVKGRRGDLEWDDSTLNF